MSDITNPEIPAQDVIDLTLEGDDVEGHGLKEVAAGLGAAAVLAGGASAAMASTGVTTHLPTVHASVAGVTVDADANQVARAATDIAGNAADAALSTTAATTHRAGTTAQGARAEATGLTAQVGQTAGEAVSGAVKAANTVVDYAKQDVKAAGTIAGNAVAWTANESGSTVNATQSRAGGTVSSTGKVAGQAVQGTQSTASRTEAGAVQAVDRKVATVLSVESRTVNGVLNVTTLLKAVNAGAGVNANSATGWMTLKAGDVVVAQWQANGETSSTTVSLPAGLGSSTLSVTYTGDDVFAASVRVLQ